MTFPLRINGVRVPRGRAPQIAIPSSRVYATPASGFSPTLPRIHASHVDVMVLGDLHLREDSLDAFSQAREQMKVRSIHVFHVLPVEDRQHSGDAYSKPRSEHARTL